jgi:hypothetical protein
MYCLEIELHITKVRSGTNAGTIANHVLVYLQTETQDISASQVFPHESEDICDIFWITVNHSLAPAIHNRRKTRTKSVQNSSRICS